MRNKVAAALAASILSIGAPLPAGAAVEGPSPATGDASPGTVTARYGAECGHAGATRTRVWDIRSHVGIGYAKPFTLAPGDVKKKWRHVTQRSRLKASYSSTADLSGEASVPLSKLVRVKAKGKLHADLRLFGSYYKAKEVTVFSTAKNTTDDNQLRVAYKANFFYAGKYHYKYCKNLYPGMNRWESTSGRWHTGRTIQDGVLLCFASYPGTVAKAVARAYCR
ncbi:hypothetical protein ACT8ZV_14310 [Nocardioides sp. MAHUQ-72]|uniref:hypothetical protein n=1 Tax=unclassified Nocardioides TaxID=2615069 RepID=UPI00361E7F04